MSEYGLWSLVPPILTVVLAIWTRNIIVSLLMGIFSGSLILSDFNPLVAALDVIEGRIFVQTSSSSNIQVLIVIMCIGGFIKLLEVSGGANAFAKGMTAIISSQKRAQFSTWLAGIAIFFTDSGNALIIGPLFRPIYRELKICKEKFAYILDSTSSPICILIPFIGWGAYIMGLIDPIYKDNGIDESSFAVLINVIPYQFYAWLTLAAVPIIIFTNRDFGPMKAAQEKYLSEDLSRTIQQKSEHEVEQTEGVASETIPNTNLSLFIAPLAILLSIVAGFLIWYASIDSLTSSHIRSTLILAYVSAASASAFLMLKHQNVTLSESLTTFIKGTETMVFVVLILIFAWCLSSVIKDLGTAATISALVGDSIPAAALPAIVFILGGIISLATGSSWGTFAILLALAIPVANNIGAPLYLTVAAVLSGGLFGDHTSPISDTTVLASIAADCPHVNHVTTQFYYAIMTGSVSFAAYLVAGFYPTPWVLLPALLTLFILIQIIMKRFGSPINEPMQGSELTRPSA
ncbi:MAG: Na+/H+ antiporter NhaC [Candidatus Azotimanducaceae bacterium]|jgi:Na+/H+ antiporter NhaC